MKYLLDKRGQTHGIYRKVSKIKFGAITEEEIWNLESLSNNITTTTS